jgi:chromosome segregation ATPase
MKFKITFVALMVACLVSIYSIINAISGGINENQAGLNRLNKSFLSLSKEFEEVKKNTDLVQHTRESYRNSLVDLSDRVGDMEEANSEIYRILKDLDEELNPKDLGVNAGLGVLTGDQALGKIEESTD